MHGHPQLILDRLERVRPERGAPAVHTPLAQVQMAAWHVDGDGEPVLAAHALGPAAPAGRKPPVHEPLGVGETWGPAGGTTWLHASGTVPEASPGVLELVLDLSRKDHSAGGQCEGPVHRADGGVVEGPRPRGGPVRLRGPGAPGDLPAGGGSFELDVEAAANPLVLGPPPGFLWPLITLSGQDHRTPTAGLSRPRGTFCDDPRVVAAGTVVAPVPIIVFFTALQRYFFRGMESGGLKA
ncbi:hypothetical protein GCM10018793_09490 [Streptomyces sulfonofaciens]|uniref:Alpha-mannosidase Ams1-like N-terminal domain-containing protein n=1 Tax=Streptomyces sulfonofaciens TaxID=68272 RepID=A0A919FTT6_9ACTN|nr:carbohydrate ABC transporter permease [Streptomyces sulfonofaciens]GHH72457.1 hypothetical protein GCM10018793_09490 [Streptomyces sulfonofaciens]